MLKIYQKVETRHQVCFDWQDGIWVVRGPFGRRWVSPEVLPPSTRVQSLTCISDFRRGLYCYKIWSIVVAGVLHRTMEGRLLNYNEIETHTNIISQRNNPTHLHHPLQRLFQGLFLWELKELKLQTCKQHFRVAKRVCPNAGPMPDSEFRCQCGVPTIFITMSTS